MITDERLRWLSNPDYAQSEPGQVAAELLVARSRIAQLVAALAAALETIKRLDLSVENEGSK